MTTLFERLVSANLVEDSVEFMYRIERVEKLLEWEIEDNIYNDLSPLVTERFKALRDFNGNIHADFIDLLTDKMKRMSPIELLEVFQKEINQEKGSFGERMVKLSSLIEDEEIRGVVNPDSLYRGF